MREAVAGEGEGGSSPWLDVGRGSMTIFHRTWAVAQVRGRAASLCAVWVLSWAVRGRWLKDALPSRLV